MGFRATLKFWLVVMTRSILSLVLGALGLLLCNSPNEEQGKPAQLRVKYFCYLQWLLYIQRKIITKLKIYGREERNTGYKLIDNYLLVIMFKLSLNKVPQTICLNSYVFRQRPLSRDAPSWPTRKWAECLAWFGTSWRYNFYPYIKCQLDYRNIMFEANLW